jgi:hypothetical protein
LARITQEFLVSFGNLLSGKDAVCSRLVRAVQVPHETALNMILSQPTTAQRARPTMIVRRTRRCHRSSLQAYLERASQMQPRPAEPHARKPSDRLYTRPAAPLSILAEKI